MGRRAGMIGRLLVVLLGGVALLAVVTPMGRYLARGAVAEGQILWRRQSIERMVADPATDAGTRAKLQLVLEARRFAASQGYAVDWDAVTRLDDESLINGVSQIAPFDIAAKQALLEADTIAERCELMVQLMQFFGRRDSDDGHVTLQ